MRYIPRKCTVTINIYNCDDATQPYTQFCIAILIHMLTQSNTNTNTAVSVVSDTKGLWIFDFGSSTRGERHNSYIANYPQCTAHLMMFKISVGRDPKIPTISSTAQIQLSTEWQRTQSSASMVQSQLPTLCLDGRNSTVCLHGPISTLNWLFFKILKFSRPSLLGMTSSTLQPISCLGFIMTLVIVISFARERKTVPNDYAPELFTRIVQSPTKLNDKI